MYDFLLDEDETEKPEKPTEQPLTRQNTLDFGRWAISLKYFDDECIDWLYPSDGTQT